MPVISGSLLFSGSLIPATDGISLTSSFSLGSDTAAWKDIWVSEGTINFIDNAGNITSTIGSGTASITGSLLGTASYADVAGQLEGDIITTVNITSAEILTMGTVPIELLPAPGVNNYYDINYIILEFTRNTTEYVYTDSPVVWIGGAEFAILTQFFIKGLAPYKWVKLTPSAINVNGDGNATWSSIHVLNENVYLQSLFANNPTTGNGTMRAIISYKVRTFGA